MSITEPNKVDIIAARPSSPIVRMVITDHLTWDDVDTHIRLLQDKINAYIDFVEGGHLSRLAEPKIPEAHEIQIVLAVQHEPSEDARRFLASIEDFLADIGLKFKVELRQAKE